MLLNKAPGFLNLFCRSCAQHDDFRAMRVTPEAYTTRMLATALADIDAKWNPALREEDTWRQDSFHLSDAADCLRRSWYRIMLASHPELRDEWRYIPDTETDAQHKIFYTGHCLHAFLQNLFVEAGWLTEEDVEVPVDVPAWNTHGNADAVMSVARYYELCELLGIPDKERGVVPGTHIVLDIKTKGSKLIPRKAMGLEGNGLIDTFPESIFKWPSTHYYMQMQGYMHLLSAQYPKRYPNIQRAYLLYVCKTDGRPFAVGIARDEDGYDMLEQRASTVVEAVASKVPPIREFAPTERECCGKGQWQKCSYNEICWRAALQAEQLSLV